jgi:hypothetical protein
MATGIWAGEDDIAATWSPRAIVEPKAKPDRDRWFAARDRARGWVPELSALDF